MQKRTWLNTANHLESLSKRLKFKLNKLQLLQALKQEDKVCRLSFSESMQALVEDENFVKRLDLTDKVTFDLSSFHFYQVNRHSRAQ